MWINNSGGVERRELSKGFGAGRADGALPVQHLHSVMEFEVTCKASSSLGIGGKLRVRVGIEGVALVLFGAFVSGDMAVDDTIGGSKHAEGVQGVVRGVAAAKVVDASGEEASEVSI